MVSIKEFRADLLDRLQAGAVYNFVDRDDFSAIDLAINGQDGEVAAFRIVITQLSSIFEKDEQVAEKVTKYLSNQLGKKEKTRFLFFAQSEVFGDRGFGGKYLLYTKGTFPQKNHAKKVP